mmetsp:Transcript_17085/g.34222  ORF Transcript_17085/g.34222 Transcript_17085/m.34222 type:complete len:139 (-) Transcript_17085:24-440(-)
MGYSITSAAITTFIAGAVMCFSKTLFFYKFGVFMVLIMFFAWFFSTFFLMSTLAVFGPTGSFGDIFCGFKGFTAKDLEDTEELLETPEEKMARQMSKKAGKWSLQDLEREEEERKLADMSYNTQSVAAKKRASKSMFD